MKENERTLKKWKKIKENETTLKKLKKLNKIKEN